MSKRRSDRRPRRLYTDKSKKKAQRAKAQVSDWYQDRPLSEYQASKRLRELRTKLQRQEALRDAKRRDPKNPDKLARILFKARQIKQEKRLKGIRPYMPYEKWAHGRPDRKPPEPVRVLPADHPICVQRRRKRSALFAKKIAGRGKGGPKDKKLTENSKIICKD